MVFFTLRLAFAVFGAIVLLWSLDAVPLSWVRLQSRSFSGRMLSEEKFKLDSLAGIQRELRAHLNASGIRDFEISQAMTLLLLNLAESSATRQGSDEADLAMLAAERSIDGTLSLNPQSSFLWLMLYSISSARHGFDPAKLTYIRASYATGPLEGWLALRRNRVALAVFPSLDRETQQRVVDEFAGMVASDSIEDAAINLIRIGWEQRERLLLSLQNIDLIERERLAKKLAAEAVKVDVPGVELDERPWR